MGDCATLGMSDQDALSENLESDPFLNFALQRFMYELNYRFSSVLVPLTIGLITSRHYLLEWNIAGTKNDGTKGYEQTSATPSKYTGLGAAIVARLVIGFWFGVGAISTIGVVDGLNSCVGALTSSSSE